MKRYIKIASSLKLRFVVFRNNDVIVYLIHPLNKFELHNDNAIKLNNWRYHMQNMFKLVTGITSSQIIASLFSNKFELVQSILQLYKSIAPLFLNKFEQV